MTTVPCVHLVTWNGKCLDCGACLHLMIEAGTTHCLQCGQDVSWQELELVAAQHPSLRSPLRPLQAVPSTTLSAPYVPATAQEYAATPQPPPVPNEKPAVWELVMADMKARDNFGRAKYGTPLQPHNGRDSLSDAYQEALDLAVYLRTAIFERDGK